MNVTRCAEFAPPRHGLVLVFAPRDARPWQPYRGVPPAARIDSDVRAAATYRKAHPGLREVNPDARKDLDAALEAEPHFERPIYHRVGREDVIWLAIAGGRQIMKAHLCSMVHLLPVLVLAAECGIAADPVRCPPQVDVRQQIGAAVAGWSVVIDDLPHLFAGITFFDGKPEDKASLAPDRESKANGKSVSTWSFAGGGQPIWLACRYAWTTVTLTRELPRQIRACAVTYDPRQNLAGLPVIEKIDCK